MTDKSSQHDKHNITKDGDRYKLTITKYFDSMDEASQYADSATNVDTPEKAASEMSIAEAEAINSNVNPAPIAAGAQQNLSGAGQEDTSNDESQTHAPHETGDEDKDSPAGKEKSSSNSKKS